ncbi:CaiB/BaiF CoA transferase family protein [Saliphagus sp. GCM10025308]
MENFKPGVTEHFGIDYDSVHDVNDDVVYCTITGFGEDSPYADTPAFDMVVQAMGGAMSVTGEPNGPPVRSNVPMGDVAPAMFAVQSILAALYARDVGDVGGERIEVSMLDAMISWLGPRAARSVVLDEPYPRTGTAHEEFAPYRRFETADSHVVVCVAAESLWPRFCRAIDHEELIDDPRFATNADRSASQDALYEHLEPIFERRSTTEWVERLRDHGVPVGPVYDTLELWNDPHVEHRELLQWLPGDRAGEELPSVAYPVQFSGDLDDPSAPEAIGASTERYLRDLGYSPETIESLAENGVI